jgi:hypothetical protein
MRRLQLQRFTSAIGSKPLGRQADLSCTLPATLLEAVWRNTANLKISNSLDRVRNFHESVSIVFS